jgi:hypothetical protein
MTFFVQAGRRPSKQKAVKDSTNDPLLVKGSLQFGGGLFWVTCRLPAAPGSVYLLV